MMARHRCRGSLCAGVVGLPLLFGTARAHAADRFSADPNIEALGSHQRHIRVDLGARVQHVSSPGLDPFAERDAIPQVTLGASYAFWARDRLSLAGAFAFDYSDWSSEARSARTDLDLRRFALGPEARFHLLRLLVLTGKLAPTLTRESATMSTGVGSNLVSTAWKFGVDATVGAAVELFGFHSGASRLPRLWISGEGGYGWTAPHELRLSPEEGGSAPERSAAVTLGDLSVSGPLYRITAGISF